MNEKHSAHGRGPLQYRIVVRGELSKRFASAFAGWTITRKNQETHILGEVLDQSQLHGLLDEIRALGIELVSVTPITDEPQQAVGRAPPAE